MRVIIVVIFFVRLNYAVQPQENYNFCRQFSGIVENVFTVYFPGIIPPNWAYENLRLTDCRQKGLDKVPRKIIPNDVQILLLSFNHLRRISASDLVNLNDLIFIDLHENCDKFRNTRACKSNLYIQPGALRNLSKLRLLLLNFDFLREFPKGLPDSLEWLVLSGTLLKNIASPNVSFLHLKGLAADWSNNTNSPFDPPKFKITSKKFKSLEYLSLEYSLWKVVPNIPRLSSLQVLNLNFNRISRVCKDYFVNSSNLRILFLQNQQIYPFNLTIEEGAFDSLINLEMLDLSLNGITYMPNKLFQFNLKLYWLDLSGNYLHQTVFNPKYLVHLRNLEYLFVDAISVGSEPLAEMQLGPSFYHLSSLKLLWLGGATNVRNAFNTISEDSIEILSSLKYLQELNIIGLKIQWLNSTSLWKLRNLKRFTASNNDIKFQQYCAKRKRAINDTGFVRTLGINKRRKMLRTKHILDWNEKKHKAGHASIFSYSYPHSRSISNYRSSDSFKYKQVSKNFEQHDGNDCTYHDVYDLSNNEISTLGKELKFAEQACILDLSHNHLNVIQEGGFRFLKNLRILLLNYNPLNFIHPFAMRNLPKLLQLQLNGVDSLIQTYTAIEVRFLQNLPSNFIVLSWLGSINPFMDYSSSWESGSEVIITSVRYLDLSNEKPVFFRHLRDVLQPFPFLTKLILRNCQLVSDQLKHPLLPSHNMLQYVDLGKNKLTYIPLGLSQVGHLTNLKILILDHNFISELSGNIITSLISLEKFNISFNIISFIEPGFFSSSKLKWLDVSNNFIARLGSDILTRPTLTSLQLLDIRNNALDCSCGVWDWLYLQSHFLPQSEQIYLPGFVPKCNSEINQLYGGCVSCSSPFRLKGLSLLWFVANSHCEISLLHNLTTIFFTVFVFFTLCGVFRHSWQWISKKVFRNINKQFRVHALSYQSQWENFRREKVLVIYELENNEVGDWVDDQLLNAMEKGNPWLSMSIAGREDSCFGTRMHQLLMNMIYSRKIVFLLTKNFAFGKRGSFILSALQEMCSSRKNNFLVLIAWSGEDGAPQVPREIQETMNRRKQHFMKFDSVNDDQEMFFEALRTALLDVPNVVNYM